MNEKRISWREFPLKPTPDVIFHGGTVLTMNRHRPRAQAVAVRGDRIVAVGDDARILALRGRGTQVIDLGGLTLMPGFVDAHTHVFNDAYYWGLDVEGAQQVALQNGITTLANMYVTPDFLAEMRALADSGRLHIRTSLYLNYTTNCGNVLGDWYKRHQPTRQPGEMLRIGGVKLFTDGGSCGAPAFSYDHPSSGYGDLWFTQDELNTIVADIHASGYQAAIHAMGDRAVEQALNAIESALEGRRGNTLRHRIEHNATVRPDMLSRYSEVGVVALIFGPYPCEWSNPLYPSRYQAWEWPWQDLLATNPDVHFAWHSDTPWVGPVAPLLHLYSMVTSHEVGVDGATICDTPAWLTKKTLTVEQALPMMTIGGAYALFRDEEVGSLEPGKFADMILVSGDPTTVDPNTLKDLEVLGTMVGGTVQYRKSGHEALCPVTRPRYDGGRLWEVDEGVNPSLWCERGQQPFLMSLDWTGIGYNT
jgi:predicted amidohydrolase YtcJ